MKVWSALEHKGSYMGCDTTVVHGGVEAERQIINAEEKTATDTDQSVIGQSIFDR